MSKFIRVLAERLGLMAAVASLAGLLHIYAGLQLKAAWILGGAFTLITVWLYILQQFAIFKPYRIVIGLNFETLREDLNLPVTEGGRFQRITFNAISATVFARSDEREYSTVLDVYEEIPCEPFYTEGNFAFRPVFILRPVAGGYKFGVGVNEEWWKVHSTKLSPQLSSKTLQSDGTLLLGFLPDGYIPQHVRRWNETISLWYPFDRKQRQWQERLTKESWTLDENYPTTINHRYVFIQYSNL